MAEFVSDGVSIAYDDIGSGHPVVLVHGFSSNRDEAWKRTGWYAAFERRGQRVVALDLRGHGQSGKPHETQAYERRNMVGDIVRLMDHLELGRVDLIGYSMGAHLSLALALSDQSRLSNLVLGGVGGRMFQPREAGPSMAEAMRADDPDSISDPMLRSFRHFADEQGEDRLALAACTEAIRTVPDRDDLFAISVPTLVAAGARDELAGDPQDLADAIRGAKAITLAGCDHFNAIPHALLKAAVFDFLDGYLDDPFG